MKELTSLSVAWDAWCAKRAGLPAIMERQKVRLRELVDFARERSRYYADKYQSLPTHIDDIRQLPIVTKPELMVHFEDWVTDPAIKLADVESFVANKSRIGESFLDRYLVITTSGSNGAPAILIQDTPAQAVMTGLTYVRGLGMITPLEYWRVFRQGGRQAALFATGGHFLGVTMVERRRRAKPWRAKMSRIISVLTPLPEIVNQLNEFQPAMVGGYATILKLLAGEQDSGRLHIHPTLITSSGETLSPQNRKQIETAFGCTLTESYGCSEATPLTITCRHQHLHVNSDWFILEAVDDSYQPVPAGRHSHTVLITNLANHVQPIIRYELGDSVTVDPDPCPCGSPLPSVRVVGRTDEILSFITPGEEEVQLLPLALSTIVEETPGIRRCQIVQTGSAQLEVRMETIDPTDPDTVWESVKQNLISFLETHKLSHVSIERSMKAPAPDPRSGKFRHVWAELGKKSAVPERQELKEKMQAFAD